MSKNGKIAVGVVILVLAVWVGYSFYNKNNSNEPIKIGVSLPMTGEAASWGEGGKAGADLAVKEINAKGGINGRMIELVYEDDKCAAKDGVTAVSKLVNIDKVDAIIGPACSAAAGPGVPVAQSAGVPTILIASAPGLTKTGDYIFRTYPSDALQGKYAAEFAYNDLGKKRASILYVQNDWGQGLDQMFANRFKELGGEIVYEEGLPQDTKDLRVTLSKMKVASSDIVYLPLYPNVALIGLKQMQDQGINLPVLGGDSFETEELTKSALSENVMYTVAVVDNPESFKQKVKNESGKDANICTSWAYDAINILAKAFDEAGIDKSFVKSELQKMSYRGGVSMSLIEFDETGDLKSAVFQTKIIKGGQSLLYSF